MLNLDQTKIKNIDLTYSSNLIKNDEHRKYFLGEPGDEHYKLIAYISTLFNMSNLIDIGTYKGNSSLAMAYNLSNTVHSFDIEDLKDLHQYHNNTIYYLDNILNPAYKELILSSPFIVVDTYHDGVFETEFHSYLKLIKWQGYLMLDDIKLNQEMMDYWNSIQEEKYDISHIGHWSGTGLVKF